jgi:hypothetical protein
VNKNEKINIKGNKKENGKIKQKEKKRKNRNKKRKRKENGLGPHPTSVYGVR